MWRISFLIFSVCLVLSCQSEHKILRGIHLSNDSWAYDQVATFELNPQALLADTTILQLTHTDQYEYENIYIKYLWASNQDTSIQNTISIPLLDKKGYWKGNCQKDYCQLDHPLHIPKALSDNTSTEESITLKVWQHSRDETLQGIRQVDLLVKSRE